jgi:hypothetical protein
LICRQYLAEGGDPIGADWDPHQTVLFKFNTKYLYGIGVGFRFAADFTQWPSRRREPVLPLAVALRSRLAETEAKLAAAAPAEKTRLPSGV